MCRKLALAATAQIGAGVLLTSPGAPAAAAEPMTMSPVGDVTATPLPLLRAKPNAAATAQTQAQTQAPARQPRRKATAEERAAADRLIPLARAAFWVRETDIDPSDQVAGVKLAAALRALGQYDEAATRAQQVLVLAPDNIDALMESARAYVAQGQGFYAIAPAEHVRALAPKDWRPLSLLGVAYAQVKREDDAMAAWRQALALSPENPAVLSNMAMELAAQGDAPQAEALLRRAAAQPSAGLAVRQDLTLVLGLQGKLTEAEQRLRRDLPPDQAEADLAYLKAVSTGAAPASIPVSTSDRSWNGVKAAGG